MKQLSRLAEGILDRHPAPAIPLHDLCLLIGKETGSRPPPPEILLGALRTDPGRLRLIEGSGDKLASVFPTLWVLGPRASLSDVQGPGRGVDPGAHIPGLVRRVRESVRVIGETIEPGSNLALARWARLLREEERVRRCVLPEGLLQPPPEPGMPPSTTRP